MTQIQIEQDTQIKQYKKVSKQDNVNLLSTVNMKGWGIQVPQRQIVTQPCNIRNEEIDAMQIRANEGS